MKLLVIEDEPGLLRSILEYFSQEQFLCEGAADFHQGLDRLEDYRYDCIILDLNLPGGSGLSLLRFLRSKRREEGVIILSAKDSLEQRIEGLDMGADDYLTKPFHLSELNARIKSLLRRKHGQGSQALEVGNLRLDVPSRCATCSGNLLPLTKYEYDLLQFLMVNRDRVVGKQAISDHLYGERSDSMESYDSVYSQIKNLKRKIREHGGPACIQTIYGLGYKFAI